MQLSPTTASCSNSSDTYYSLMDKIGISKYKLHRFVSKNSKQILDMLMSVDGSNLNESVAEAYLRFHSNDFVSESAIKYTYRNKIDDLTDFVINNKLASLKQFARTIFFSDSNSEYCYSRNDFYKSSIFGITVDIIQKLYSLEIKDNVDVELESIKALICINKDQILQKISNSKTNEEILFSKISETYYAISKSKLFRNVYDKVITAITDNTVNSLNYAAGVLDIMTGMYNGKDELKDKCEIELIFNSGNYYNRYRFVNNENITSLIVIPNKFELSVGSRFALDLKENDYNLYKQFVGLLVIDIIAMYDEINMIVYNKKHLFK